MYPKNSGARPSRAMVWLALVRALLLGGSGAVAAGLFGTVGGAILCLADGLPWAYAGAWGLRGVLGGLVAGAMIGVLSGFHHVEERRPEPKPEPAAPSKPPLAERSSPSARPADAPDHNGVHQNGYGDRGRGSAGKAVLF
jgi:hypothetical protein